MFEIAKIDKAERLVFGFANVSARADGTAIVDLQNDEIPPAVLEKAAYQFVLDFRESGEMHKGGAVGELVESMMFTPEKLKALGLAENAIAPRWWVGFKLSDESFAKVATGQYRMFSIQGKYTADMVDD